MVYSETVGKLASVPTAVITQQTKTAKRSDIINSFLRRLTIREALNGNRQYRFSEERNRLFSRKGTVSIAVILFTSHTPLKMEEIYALLSSLGIASNYEVVKKTVHRLKTSGFLVHENGYYSINYYYRMALSEIMDKTDYDMLFNIIKDTLYNNSKLYSLSLQKGRFGTVRDGSGHIENKKLNKKEFYEKIKRKAEQKLGRQLEKPEETVLKILSDHYHDTGSLWIDPETFEEQLYTTNSSSSYQLIGYSIDSIWKALGILASHRIAYSWVRRGKRTKRALYRSFGREAETQ